MREIAAIVLLVAASAANAHGPDGSQPGGGVDTVPDQR